MFSFLKKKEESKLNILAPMNGKLVYSKDIPDDTFREEILGKCVAIEPTEGKVYSPVDGTLSVVAKTKHALNITSADGIEILIHIGMDTVSLKGEPFNVIASQGAEIKKGDLLMEFDMEMIKAAGLPIISPVVICNSDDYEKFDFANEGDVAVGDTIIKIS